MEDKPPRPRRPRKRAGTNPKAARKKAEWDAEEEVLRLVPDDYDGSPDTRPGAVPPPGRRRGGGGDNRNNLKVELGQRWSQIVREVERGDYSWEDFARELSAEELVRGQLKNSQGTFGGRPPRLVPRAFYLVCMSEIKRRFDEKIQDRLLDAATELIDLSKIDGGLNPKDRARVLQYLIERVMGGIPKEVVLRQQEPWEEMIVGVLREAPPDAPAPYVRRRKPPMDEDDEGE